MNKQRQKALLFASYDFSNSGFLIIFQSFLFPIFLSTALASTSIDDHPERIWGWMIAASSVLAIVSAPFIGRLADIVGKGNIFAVMVLITAVFSGASVLAFDNVPFLLIVAFLIFNTSFELSQSLYDSFLLDLTTARKSLTSLSTFAWGFGYLGGAFFVVIFLLLNRFAVNHGALLTVVAILYLFLSFPSILTFRKIAPNLGTSLSRLQINSIFRLNPPVSWSQLAIYWIIADCVATVMYFAPLYMKTELGLSLQVVGGLSLAAQLMAFPLTVLMGKIANRFGILFTLRICLGFWIVCLVGLALAVSLLHVIFVMCGLALVIGSTQALLRAQFASRVKRSESAEGLGYYAIAQKSSSIASPLIVIAAANVFGSMRASFFVLTLLIIISIALSTRLKDPEISSEQITIA